MLDGFGLIVDVFWVYLVEVGFDGVDLSGDVGLVEGDGTLHFDGKDSPFRKQEFEDCFQGHAVEVLRPLAGPVFVVLVGLGIFFCVGFDFLSCHVYGVPGAVDEFVVCDVSGDGKRFAVVGPLEFHFAAYEIFFDKFTLPYLAGVDGLVLSAS